MSASPRAFPPAADHPAPLEATAATLVQFIRDEIPLARAMDLSLCASSPDQLSLAVPLAPNVNDKGCAFGGSLVSLMTLAGWALVELALRRAGEDCDVFVGESTVRYLAPVWSDFRADARLAAEAGWPVFFSTLAARGRARIEVVCEVPGSDGKPAATLSARFVAKRRGGD
ncbi:YiiD C-terminal domain-containing protein [Dyella sp.]|jgi:thioesterase domain-containing protein|uniref:YiiD C-terminal domain-containing protein n=1 Tax=Dyella sp. TaxID=1869338 RepID=UPI002D76BB20|nr:YiiD C-terminal domain-containing protein [Dyella sp.]HET6431423.1 YiiD C-terminal domain-containing protein [Dyella sp.]